MHGGSQSVLSLQKLSDAFVGGMVSSCDGSPCLFVGKTSLRLACVIWRNAIVMVGIILYLPYLRHWRLHCDLDNGILTRKKLAKWQKIVCYVMNTQYRSVPGGIFSGATLFCLKPVWADGMKGRTQRVDYASAAAEQAYSSESHLCARSSTGRRISSKEAIDFYHRYPADLRCYVKSLPPPPPENGLRVVSHFVHWTWIFPADRWDWMTMKDILHWTFDGIKVRVRPFKSWSLIMSSISF